MAPTVVEYFPFSQEVHADAWSAENDPTEQYEHVVDVFDSTAVEYIPEGQLTQVVALNIDE